MLPVWMEVDFGMTLSATTLSIAQRCPRRFAFEQSDPTGVKWFPKDLFAACLRSGVKELGQGVDPKIAALHATSLYLQTSTSPGIEARDPFTVARDYCAALSTGIEALSRGTILATTSGPLISIGRLSWQVSAFQDETGELHRWAVVDKLDEDSLYRELHSWHVAGDMAMTDAPMTIHFFEIGSLRDGRLRSPWARTFKHPAIKGKFKFQSRSGESLKGSWESVWFAEGHQDPKIWVDLMEADNLKLISQHPLKQLSPEAIEKTRREIGIEADRLSGLNDPFSIPMYRPACDFPAPCPWQDKCFG